MSCFGSGLWILFWTLIVVGVQCRVAHETKNAKSTKNVSIDSTVDVEANQVSKQLFLGANGKETNTPNFVRLVVMRLLYGLASTMGLEERLESAFNGVLVPPNVNEGFFNFGELGGGGGGEDIFGDLGDFIDL